MRLDVINGPNLNWLGRREPALYGVDGLDELERRLRTGWPEVEWSFFQSNHEGALLDRLQWAADHVDGVILNPAGYSHTSVALLDTLLALPIPVVEVHLSHVLAREEFRQTLLSARGATAFICGLGLASYEAAARYLLGLAGPQADA
jgi:3-dehydroquinate dehydratase-2